MSINKQTMQKMKVGPQKRGFLVFFENICSFEIKNAWFYADLGGSSYVS